MKEVRKVYLNSDDVKKIIGEKFNIDPRFIDVDISDSDCYYGSKSVSFSFEKVEKNTEYSNFYANEWIGYSKE